MFPNTARVFVQRETSLSALQVLNCGNSTAALSSLISMCLCDAHKPLAHALATADEEVNRPIQSIRRSLPCCHKAISLPPPHETDVSPTEPTYLYLDHQRPPVKDGLPHSAHMPAVQACLRAFFIAVPRSCHAHATRMAHIPHVHPSNIRLGTTRSHWTLPLLEDPYPPSIWPCCAERHIAFASLNFFYVFLARPNSPKIVSRPNF